MEKKYRYPRLICLFLVPAVMALVVISGSGQPCRAGDHLAPMAHSVALMPFFKGKKVSESVSVLDLKPEFLDTNEEVMDGAEGVLTGLVQQALEKRLGNALLSREKVEKAYDMILAEDPDKTPRGLVATLAERLGVEYVLAGNVWRFTDREGNALAVGKPASMAFKLHLIHIPTKTRIWAEACDKTQQSLSENVFKAADFIKQRGRWVTVDELARIAVDDLVKDMPF